LKKIKDEIEFFKSITKKRRFTGIKFLTNCFLSLFFQILSKKFPENALKTVENMELEEAKDLKEMSPNPRV
jgi:hypothetical protein